MTKPEENKTVHVINRSDEINKEVRYVSVDDFRENEISLIDVVKVFVRRKKLFLGAILLVSFLGFIYAFSKPVVYGYFVSVEIGQSGGGMIEDAKTLLNKINKNYIPINSSQFLKSHPDNKSVPLVTASNDKESKMIFLESKGVLDDQEIHFEFINSLVHYIVADHQKVSTVHRKEFELSSGQINNVIKRLKDEENLLISQKSRMKDKESFLRKRVLMIQKSLAESEKTRSIAAKNTNTEGKSWALLTINNDLRASRERLSSLEEQLNIGLKEQNEKLDNSISQNIRAQSEQVGQLSKIQLKLDSLLETRALSQPLKSIKPVSKSKSFIILLSIVIGVFIAIFAVMIVEFASKVREQSQA
jgi:Chain length determinant protein